MYACTLCVSSLGFVGVEELKHTLEREGLDVSTSQLKVIIRNMDRNGDGVVSFDEFKKL